MSNALQCETKYFKKHSNIATLNKMNTSVGQKQHSRLAGLLDLGIGRGDLKYSCCEMTGARSFGLMTGDWTQAHG